MKHGGVIQDKSRCHSRDEVSEFKHFAQQQGKHPSNTRCRVRNSRLHNDNCTEVIKMRYYKSWN